MKARKTWQDKLRDSKGLPEICATTEKQSKRWGAGTFVVPAPIEVDELMKQVPKGKLVTINELRLALAQKHKVTFACPITTGIFAWIAAHAAQEAIGEGKKRVTPFWRTLKSGGELNEKYPGGIPELVKRLQAEGHKIVQKGNKHLVVDYTQALYQPKVEQAARP
jgi:hypothetical protein